MLLISLRPELAQEVYSGSKRCEMRKNRAHVSSGDRVAIYETKPRGAITGTFIVERTHHAPLDQLWAEISDSGVSKERFVRYFASRRRGFAMRIRDARRLELEIGLKFARAIDTGFRAPQSFLYLREDNGLAAAIESQLRQAIIHPKDLTNQSEGDYERDIPSARVWHAQHVGHERSLVFDEQRSASHQTAELAD